MRYTENNYQTKSKTLKCFIIVLVLVLSLIIIITIKPIANATETFLVKSYISVKYKKPIYNLKTKKYLPSEFYLNDSSFIPIPCFGDAVWVFDYKGKDLTFSVSEPMMSLFTGHILFEDDIQLESISNTSAEYLKKNVNKNICGISTFSDRDINAYSHGKRVSIKNTKEFLHRSIGYGRTVYIRVDNPQSAADTLDSEYIYENLCSIFDTDINHISVYLIDNTVEMKAHTTINEDSYTDRFWSYYGVEREILKSDEIKNGTNNHIKLLKYKMLG